MGPNVVLLMLASTCFNIGNLEAHGKMTVVLCLSAFDDLTQEIKENLPAEYGWHA